MVFVYYNIITKTPTPQPIFIFFFLFNENHKPYIFIFSLQSNINLITFLCKYDPYTNLLCTHKHCPHPVALYSLFFYKFSPTLDAKQLPFTLFNSHPFSFSFCLFGSWVSVLSLRYGFNNGIIPRHFLHLLQNPQHNVLNSELYASSLGSDHYCDYKHYNELKMKTLWRKMIWNFGLSCFLPPHSKNLNNGGDDNDEKSKANNLEHNKAWLLAESGGAELTSIDPPSVHSSFRFSFYSQVELESMNMNSSASATVLMVNLENGLCDTRAQELKWRRIQSLERSLSPVANSLIRLSYGEILAATRNFSKGRVLGRGALSFVFRGKVGFLRTSVAIKRLDKEDKESSKAFCRELMIASSLHHPNIVPLVGFCIDPEEGLFLVYKYVSGGSLERHLQDKKRGVKGSSILPWSVRYKVALGIAESVAYLHNGTERCVVHRDIKPSNILLSSKKAPKLCDFGLATWTSAPSVPFLCKTVKGTFGYLAPEYFQHGKVSDKTDVYAFGVVLLELLTGRKPIEARRPPGEENLVLWAKPFLLKGMAAVEELLDPRLKCTLRNSPQIARMIQAAAACVSSEESRRPGIDEIIALLRGEENFIYSSRKKHNFSGIIDCYPQLQQTKSEMKSHLALAMLGVSEFEDDEHLYCH